MIFTAEELRSEGYKEVRVVATNAKFANLATRELFEPTQVETFKDVNDKLFVFYSRPGDDGNSRYSLEDLKINFRELNAPAT
jgi:hypothetical protein